MLAVLYLLFKNRLIWDQKGIDEGVSLLREAHCHRVSGREPPGRCQLQAAIATCRVLALHADTTDFARAAFLYDSLARIAPSPVADLNGAVAVGMSEGSEVGPALVDKLEKAGSLKGCYLLPTTKADPLRRLGRWNEASWHCRGAHGLAPSAAERRYLSK